VPPACASPLSSSAPPRARKEAELQIEQARLAAEISLSLAAEGVRAKLAEQALVGRRRARARDALA
jgi:hypothetical protein